MPKPHPNEKKKDYIARCMSDDKAKRERPDSLARLVYCTKIYESEMAAEKVSFDYDETLTTEKGMQKAKEYKNKGAILYIISARGDKQSMLEKAKELGIPESRVYATGSNKAKIEKIKELGISVHFDNNPNVIKELKNKGKLI